MSRKDLLEDAANANGPIHDWFELSYSNYLILHRSVLQAMPRAWQKKLVALIKEANERFDLSKLPSGFMVKARGSGGRFIEDPYANYRHPIPIPRRRKK